VQQQKHRTILKRMRTALRDNPDYARGWLHLGRAYHALGQNVASANALAKACAKGIEEACNRAAATP